MVVVNLSDSNVFTPLKIGPNELKHRVVLAPLTRCRVDDETRIINADLVKEYYTQRTTREGTLAISETLSVTSDHVTSLPPGFVVPSFESGDAVEVWNEVVDAVHANKSFIFIQLWFGRFEPNFVNNLRIEKIESVIEAYVKAAGDAFAIGADGVEVHFANGYTNSQFLNPLTNSRTDRFGGSVENRCAYPLEVIDRIGEKFGYDKVSIRISPFHRDAPGQTIHPQMLTTHSYLVAELESRRLEGKEIAYIHAVEPRPTWADDSAQDATKLHENIEFLPAIWNGSIIRAGNFINDAEKAKDIVKTYPNTAIAFGRYYISNPDLPDRLEKGVELTPYNRPTFYTRGTQGYTDYPVVVEEPVAEKLEERVAVVNVEEPVVNPEK